jgi:uncharacterized protein YggU (UPF0235/DUF167 family)
LLAGKAGCRPRQINIVAGEKSRNKIIELPGGAILDP